MRSTIPAALLLAAPAIWPAAAQSPSPYDMTYRLRGGEAVALRADMSDKAAAVGTLPAGATGIVLRWCRSEIPFGTWQFGSAKEQLKLLDQRWCEVSYDGTVGAVPGSVLAPE
jgi:hypothetical protein